MDSITHTVIGACLGEAIGGKQLGKKAMLYGAIFNNLPDIDVVTAFWTSEAHELLAHRGITHSILFAVIFTPLLAWLFRKREKNRALSFRGWLLLIGSGLFLHITLDALTAYGTGWFEPFSHYRVSFNTFFILDPFFSIPLLITSVLLLILKKTAFTKRKWINLVGASLSILYLVMTICFKLYVNHVIEKDLTAKHIVHSSFLATPSPMNNLLWYSAAKSGDQYYTGYFSILDKDGDIGWEAFQKNDSLLIPYNGSADVQDLMRFSKDYYCVAKNDSGVQFSDIRFGQVAGWRVKQAPFVFKLNIKKTGTGSILVEQAKFEDITSEDFKMLIERVRGK